MQLSSTVNDGIVQTVDRLSSTTTNTYSYKAKTNDINDSLDWYFQIAFKAGLNWEFDDTNRTTPPIDTQNIVSGTNRYKVSAFTEKILNLIKLEVLDSTGKGVTLYPETFDTLGQPLLGNASGRIDSFTANTFQELYLNAPGGIPTNYCKFGDFIYLRPNPNYSVLAGLKAYFNRAALKFTFVSVTVTIASPGVFTATAHGLQAGDTVILETDGALPTGLLVDTQYYVIAGGLTANTFELSLTAGGSAIVTSDSQSGNHAFLKTSSEPGIPSIHHQALCRKTSLTFRSLPANAGSQTALASLTQQVLLDEQMIGDFFSERTKDMRRRMTAMQQNNK